MDDNMIYVVSRSTGEYSDRHEEPIRAFTTEEAAKLFVTLASEQFRTAVNLHPVPDFDSPDDGDDEKAWERRNKRFEDRTTAARQIAVLDPFSIDEDGYEDPPYYHYRAVPLATEVKI